MEQDVLVGLTVIVAFGVGGQWLASRIRVPSILVLLLAGFIARFSLLLERGEWTFVLDGLAGFYLLLVMVPIGIGVLMLALTPLLRRWMHGVS